MRPNSFETLPDFFQRPDVSVGVVSPRGIACTRITPSRSRKRATIPADGDFSNFFLLGRLWMVPYYGVLFCLRFKMMDTGFTWCKIPGQE